MWISHVLLMAARRRDLVDDEIECTSDLDRIDVGFHQPRAKALLRAKKLWPIPTTRTALEAALKRRLGKPRGTSPRPGKVIKAVPAFSPLQSFARSLGYPSFGVSPTQ